jgi:hypothetical protein
MFLRNDQQSNRPASLKEISVVEIADVVERGIDNAILDVETSRRNAMSATECPISPPHHQMLGVE